MSVVVGISIILALAIVLTVVDVGTNNDHLEPWNRKLWPTHARKAAVYFAVGLAALLGFGAAGLAVEALTTASKTTTHGVSLGAGVSGELLSARWVWHRELRRDPT